MKVTIEPCKDILSLYTPFAPVNKAHVEHTRSVLLQRRQNEPTFTIVSSVSFALVLSIPQTVPLEYLLRHMLLSYTRHAYAITSKENEMVRHTAICRAYTPKKEEHEHTEGIDPSYIALGARYFLRRIDRENRQDYEHVMKKGVLKAENKEGRAWRWFKSGSVEIEDETYRAMRNINFIRDVKQVSAMSSDKKTFQNDTQYRILFDNHLILYYFLIQFKRGTVVLEHKETKFDCSLVLLDPVATTGNKHEKFEGANYVYYIEKQLNSVENRDFHTTVHFPETYPYTGGLLHPSTYEANDTLYMHEENTIQAMLANSSVEDNTGQRLTKKQQEASKGFRLRYNRFYVDLSTNTHTHVEYFQRQKTLISEQPTKKKKTPTTDKPKEAVKLGKNQPTLHLVLANMSQQDNKRKLTSEEVIASLPITNKKPRLAQAKLNSFFI